MNLGLSLGLNKTYVKKEDFSSPLLDIPDLYALYDPSFSGGLVISGSGISRMKDLSGNNRHADYTGSGDLLTTTVNGSRAVHFNDTGAKIHGLRTADLNVTGEDWTIINIFSFNTVSASRPIWTSERSPSDNDRRVELEVQAGFPSPDLVYDMTDSGGSATVENFGSPGSGPLYCSVATMTDGENTFYLNDGKDPYTNTVAGQRRIECIQFGLNTLGGGTQRYNLMFSAFYSRKLSIAEINQIMVYLALKFNAPWTLIPYDYTLYASEDRPDNNRSWKTDYDSIPDIAYDLNLWYDWAFGRVQEFMTACPLERTTTYYFSTSGNDSTGDGSEGNPWQSIAKINSTISASSGDIRIRLKAGDVWDTTTGINTDTKSNLTIDYYNSGNKPLINAFTQKYNSTGWTLDTGNTYYASEANDIAWIRDQADRLFENTGPWSRQDSLVNCRAASNSFFWDSGTSRIYLNLGGTDPNTLNLEAVISNSNNGVLVYFGTGQRVHGIRCDGWGIHRTVSPTQTQPFTVNNSNNSYCLLTECDGYFSSSHTMHHYQGTPGVAGGKCMWIGCDTGYTSYNSAGETMYNAFNPDGGQEAWFIDCDASYGTLPGYQWTFTTNVRGDAYFGHASSSSNPQNLFVVLGGVVKDSVWPGQRTQTPNHIQTPSDIDDYTTYRCFIVDNHDRTGYPGTTTKAAGTLSMNQSTVAMNNRIYKRVASSTTQLYSVTGSVGNGRFINNYIEIDLSARNSSVAMYNATTGDNKSVFDHCFFKYTGAGVAGNSLIWALDYDMRGTTSIASGTSRNGKMRNSIVSADITGTPTVYCGFNNVDANQRHNAYFGLTQSTGLGRGYDEDPGLVALSGLPVLGTEDSDLLQAGEDISVRFDINGKVRTYALPDIGPQDFSSI